MKFNLFFKAQQEVIGQDEESNDIMGYKLGPADLIVHVEQVVNLLTVGSWHLIVYLDAGETLANQVKDWPEFAGFGYIDMVMRVAVGLSNLNISDIKYITGAHWYSSGEWRFGSVKDWEDAGSPPIVWFGKYRDFLGVDIQ